MRRRATISSGVAAGRTLLQTATAEPSASSYRASALDAMSEADALSDRIAVIDHGRIIALDTPGGLKSRVRDMNVVEVELFGLPEEMLPGLRALPND